MNFMEKITTRNRLLKRAKVALFFLSCLLLSLNESYSINKKTPLSKFGIYAGGGLNYSNTEFLALPGVPNCCPRFDEGFGSSIQLLGIFNTKISKSQFSFELKTGYSFNTINFSAIEDEVLSVNFVPYDGQFEHIINTSFHNLVFHPAINYEFFPNFLLSLGPKIEYNILNNFEQEEVLIDPEDGVFTDTGENIRNKNDGNIQEINELPIYLNFGFLYSDILKNNDKYDLRPEISFDYGLNDLVSVEQWQNYRLNLGLSLFFNPKKTSLEKLEQPSIDLPIENQTPQLVINTNKITKDNFELKVVGVEDGDEKPVLLIKSDEYISFRLKPLLTYLFFADNSAVIPKRYNLLDNSQVSDFSISEVSKDSTLGIYYNLLNIIGKRMQLNPEAKIDLIGNNSNRENELNNLEISKSRAEVIRDYLISTWNIDEDRIEVNHRNLPIEPSNINTDEGIEENRRVEILSDEWEIIKPIMAEDTSYNVSPPILRFYTTSNFKTNEISWALKIFDSQKILNSMDGSGKPPELIDVNLENIINSENQYSDSLYYSFEIFDSENESIDYSGAIPIDFKTIQKKRLMNDKNLRVDKYNLILFSFDKYDFSDANKRISDLIKSRINESSKVWIKAYTDRTGSDDHNFLLSNNRAKSTADLLNIRGAKYEGLGESILLFDNNLPEGRFYCRTVEIYVETETE